MTPAQAVLFNVTAARQSKGSSAGISEFYGTAYCAEMLIVKANAKLGVRFFESGGRGLESLRARHNSSTCAAHVLTTVPFEARCAIRCSSEPRRVHRQLPRAQGIASLRAK
jgi:hypothetical protein